MFTPYKSRIFKNGPQDFYKFQNGYGASVINNEVSYGLELAVLRFSGIDGEDWEINYDTPITDDVLMYLTEQDVEDTLNLIRKLPSVSPFKEVKNV